MCQISTIYMKWLLKYVLISDTALSPRRMTRTCLFLCLCASLVPCFSTYKPVIFMHGIFAAGDEADTFFKWIKDVRSYVYFSFIWGTAKLNTWQIPHRRLTPAVLVNVIYPDQSNIDNIGPVMKLFHKKLYLYIIIFFLSIVFFFQLSFKPSRVDLYTEQNF